MFRTEFDIDEIKTKINVKSKLMFFGSCFTENIGAKINNLYLKSIINPFGILYNPASVAENLRILINNKKFSEKDLIFHNQRWQSFNHHGKFSGKEKNKTLEHINNEIEKSAEFLKTTEFLFITFGTAWVYKHSDKTKKIVANCHKFPTSHFVRESLSINEISTNYNDLIKELKRINPNIKIIFTVSPIRHLKDGANGNQLSKSTLLLAISEIVKQNNNTFYFPSYEIVMDDLRDYRFYSSDMIHVNELAINYIWDKLKTAYFDSSLIDYEKKIDKINKALNHRVDDPTSKNYIDFMKKTNERIKNIEKEFNINLSSIIK